MDHTHFSSFISMSYDIDMIPAMFPVDLFYSVMSRRYILIADFLIILQSFSTLFFDIPEP